LAEKPSVWQSATVFGGQKLKKAETNRAIKSRASKRIKRERRGRNTSQ
jgi:hypothetical protein